MERGALEDRIAVLERRVAELDAELESAISDATAFRALVSLPLPPVGFAEREALLLETERAAKLGTWVWDTKTNSVTWSRVLYTILGYDPERDRPSTEAFFLAVHPEDRERIRSVSAENARTGASHAEECRILRKNGEVREIVLDGTYMQDESGGFVGFVGTVTDVTERNVAARALRRSEALLRHAQRIAHMGSWRWEFAGNRVEWSEELYAILGIERSVVPTPELFYESVHPHDRPRARREAALAARGEINLPSEYRVLRSGTGVRWVRIDSRRIEEADGRVSGLMGTVLDVTDRRRLEEQLLQSQKMEAIGRLAGGVAHDFNNLLMVIRGYTALLQSRNPMDELQQIGEAVDRAATLTHQLLAFSRRSVVSTRLIDLDGELAGAIRLARPLIGDTIHVRFELDARPWLVRAEAGQMNQLILNLVINARDAMPNGGTLSFSTSRVVLGPSFVATHPDATLGEYVLFSVADDGTGMSDEVKTRALEPFFTTKECGRGTGLGLSTVFGIVRQSGGFLELESKEGQGTTISVYLPRAEDASRADSAPAPTPL